MAKVYTKPEGLKVRIGHYGEASNETPAVVPEAVAHELAAAMKGDPCRPEVIGYIGRPAHETFRIVHDVHHKPEKKAPAAAQEKE